MLAAACGLPPIEATPYFLLFALVVVGGAIGFARSMSKHWGLSSGTATIVAIVAISGAVFWVFETDSGGDLAGLGRTESAVAFGDSIGAPSCQS